jgi:UDP-glucose 4-epimerase
VFGGDYPTPDGTAVRDYVHVADLADAHVRALAYLLQGGETGAVNLGSGQGASVTQVIDTARSAVGMEVPFHIAPRRPGDPALLVADPTQARKVLDWSARRSDLLTIVADAWRWHQHRFGVPSNLTS